MRKHAATAAGFAGILVVSLVSGLISRGLHSPFSSAVLGMIVLLALLFLFERLTLPVAMPFERAAHVLLRCFPLLFVPSCVGAMRYGSLLHQAWFGIAVALVGSTVLGIVVAATLGTLVARRSRSQ